MMTPRIKLLQELLKEDGVKLQIPKEISENIPKSEKATIKTSSQNLNKDQAEIHDFQNLQLRDSSEGNAIIRKVEIESNNHKKNGQDSIITCSDSINSSPNKRPNIPLPTKLDSPNKKPNIPLPNKKNVESPSKISNIKIVTNEQVQQTTQIVIQEQPIPQIQGEIQMQSQISSPNKKITGEELRKKLRENLNGGRKNGMVSSSVGRLPSSCKDKERDD
jgi:hypothetical protein